MDHGAKCLKYLFMKWSLFIGNFKIIKDMRAEAGLKKILLYSQKRFANFHEVMTKCDIFFDRYVL